MDCTGCQLCISACPDKALSAVPLSDALEQQDSNWLFAQQLPRRNNLMARGSVKGSQLVQPYLEVRGGRGAGRRGRSGQTCLGGG